MEERALAYQHKMYEAYRSSIRNIYNHAAATVFKKQYFPADPFEGELIDAAFLEIPDLVAIFEAAKALENEGNSAFVDNLIHYRDRGQYVTPAVRVNYLYLEKLRQRKAKICKYLQKACSEVDSAIEYADDAQLSEYLRQAQECLAIETEVINEI